MLELKGKYGTAKVFTDKIEEKASSQIINLMNQPFIEGSMVRIMSDVHAGAGCTIGTTLTITDKVVPNLVGVDIGCGMRTSELYVDKADLERLDRVIRERVPSGFKVRETMLPIAKFMPLEGLRCRKHVNIDRAKLSIGTLGGGNHFIELGRAEKSGKLYLVVHSGSRNLGKQIADCYQNEAEKAMFNRPDNTSLIRQLKAEGRQSEIESILKSQAPVKFDRNLAYCEGQLLEDYLHDMCIAQQYAEVNREEIFAEIGRYYPELASLHNFTTTHNYIDMDSNILRKGAVSARTGERVLIPINMRDGSILAVGKGNPDWNYSAPHGAGRLMSRSAAKKRISINEFQDSMAGIYSSTVNSSTLDEAPQAYKPMDEIIKNIGDTVEILDIIKPLYNFKAAE